MPQYFVAIFLPDDFDPSTQTEETIGEIHAANRELTASGALKFACGLFPPGNAKSLRYQPDGTVSVTDGPYTETKEYLGGFSVIEAADLNEALEWARKTTVGCHTVQELRQFMYDPAI